MAMTTFNDFGGRFAQRSVFWMILAMGIGIFVVIALVMTFEQSEATVKTDQMTQQEVAQRPTGAGTNPDGAVDEATEGLLNETATDDFVESTAATDPETVPNDGDGPDPVTSATEVDAAGGESENVNRMIDQSQSASDGSAGTEDTGAASSADDPQDSQKQATEDDQASSQIPDDVPPLAFTEGDVGNQTAAMLNAGQIPVGVTGSLDGSTLSAEDGQDIIVDPNNGYLGQDPDGGAAAFIPTPSGPEGRDDNPWTTN